MKPVRLTSEPSSFVVGGTQVRSALPVTFCTVTVTGRIVLPPGPVQVSVKVLSLSIGPTLWLPDVGLLPDQEPPAEAPPAVHEVALVEDQVRVLEPPAFTVDGLALNDTLGIGGGATDTVTDLLAPPPAPVHVRTKVLVAVRLLRTWLPDVALVPDQSPEATQESAFVDDQLTVEEPL